MKRDNAGPRGGGKGLRPFPPSGALLFPDGGFAANVSPGEIRPSGVTAVASAITNPAPPTARDPKCTRCQSPTTPSVQLYWHIGETPMRLRIGTPRKVIG